MDEVHPTERGTTFGSTPLGGGAVQNSAVLPWADGYCTEFQAPCGPGQESGACPMPRGDVVQIPPCLDPQTLRKIYNWIIGTNNLTNNNLQYVAA